MPKSTMFNAPTGPQPIPPSTGGKQGYISKPVKNPSSNDPGMVKNSMGKK